jgi:hypothetical protein
MHLVIDDELWKSLGDQIPAGFRVTLKSALDPQPLLEALGAGDSLLWIGEGSGIPADLWIGTFRPFESSTETVIAEDSPLILDGISFRPTRLSSAFIRPTKEMYLHNVDEEPMADFLPILEARDRFGRVVGYPGVLMAHFAPSLVGHRFHGSECFFFLFDRPAEALPSEGWLSLIQSVADRFRSALHLRHVQTDYASYRCGERVRVRAVVANLCRQATAAEIRCYVKAPGSTVFRYVVSHRRCPAGLGESEAVCDLLLGGDPGLWVIRVEACQDPAHAEELAIEGNPLLVDRREVGVVLFEGAPKTPSCWAVNGASIQLEGRDNFWTGTHYYPSSSWWEWLWRDFRPLAVARDLAGMRRTGYRIVRIWIDPILDEQTLRAMDAAIYLAARNGIVLDVCIFTQWVRTIGFERENGEHVRFDFRGRYDFNLYGISLRNLALQREYVRLLARRWRDVGNIMYNLTNETYLKDPDPTQMDPEVGGWEDVPEEKGTLRDALLFRRWVKEITAAIREAGGRQPILPGYMFSLADGGDVYLGNRDGEIEPWHSYNAALTGPTLACADPICSKRPVILEECGALGWNRREDYDRHAHYALGAGAAAALSYEWGVSWLARDSCFYAVPLREFAEREPDPRWFGPAIEIAKSWPSRGVSICATPSGFGYGSIYHGTPFPAEAAIALGRLGLMGGGLGRARREEGVYLLIPTGAWDRFGLFEETIRALWREKVVFGICQQDCLDHLPQSARVLICPGGVPRALAQRIEAIRCSGVEIYSDDGWKVSDRLGRVSVTPGEGVDLLTRRTVQGTLYSLFAEGPAGSITLETEEHAVLTFGLTRYAMVHQRANGLGLLEASGEVKINGAPLCAISRGRAFIASEDGQDLTDCARVRLLVTEPTRVEFAREIASCAVLEEGVTQPVGTFSVGRTELEIDGEMSCYVLELSFRSS